MNLAHDERNARSTSALAICPAFQLSGTLSKLVLPFQWSFAGLLAYGLVVALITN